MRRYVMSNSSGSRSGGVSKSQEGVLSQRAIFRRRRRAIGTAAAPSPAATSTLLDGSGTVVAVPTHVIRDVPGTSPGRVGLPKNWPSPESRPPPRGFVNTPVSPVIVNTSFVNVKLPAAPSNTASEMRFSPYSGRTPLGRRRARHCVRPFSCCAECLAQPPFRTAAPVCWSIRRTAELHAIDDAFNRDDHIAANALFRGELLQELVVPGVSSFMEWLDATRRTLHRRVAEAAETLSRTAQAEGDAVAAPECGDEPSPYPGGRSKSRVAGNFFNRCKSGSARMLVENRE